MTADARRRTPWCAPSCCRTCWRAGSRSTGGCCIIDGGKGLRKALGEVFGDAAVIQRCQLHKGRNLDALLPKARHAYVRAAVRRAYRAASARAARRQLTTLAAWLE